MQVLLCHLPSSASACAVRQQSLPFGSFPCPGLSCHALLLLLYMLTCARLVIADFLHQCCGRAICSCSFGFGLFTLCSPLSSLHKAWHLSGCSKSFKGRSCSCSVLTHYLLSSLSHPCLEEL